MAEFKKNQEEAEGAHAVEALGWRVLKEVAQEFVWRERHGPGSRLARGAMINDNYFCRPTTTTFAGPSQVDLQGFNTAAGSCR